jgi:hypothetical protein
VNLIFNAAEPQTSHDGDNLMGENMNITKRNRRSSQAASSNEIGPEVNIQKTKCMFMPHHQNAGNIKM